MATANTPLLSSSQVRAIANPTFLWRSGVILATCGIIAGAFGSHGLKSVLSGEQLSSWKIASQYAIINGVALLTISQHPRYGKHKFAGPAILAGATIFSGTIAALLLGGRRFRFLGPITPLGGSIMIAGYIALLF